MAAPLFTRVPTGDAGIDRNLLLLEQAFAAIPVPKPPNVVTVRGDYKVTGLEDVLHVDAQAGPVRITLLQPSSANRPLSIKQVNLQTGKSRVNQVTVVNPDGASRIAGAPSFDLDLTGTGSVAFTADNEQHWPSASAGGNPPISPTPTPVPPFVPPTPPPPVPPPAITPWIAPVPYGTDNTFISNTLGTETWGAECMVDFTQAPGTLTAWWWFESQDSGSNGTINIRIGGSANKALDGVVVATLNETSTSIAPHSLATPFATPSGLLRVTLSTQSAAGQKCTASGVNLQFR